MGPYIQPHLACPCDRSEMYNPFKIMTKQTQIVDFSTALPVANVNVYLKDNPSIGTITNENGVFTFEAKPDDIIVLSHVAYGKYPIKFKEVQPVEYIEEKSNTLDEVVVLAKKKKSWLVAAGLAVLGLFIITSNSEEEEKPSPKKPTPKKNTVKAKV